MKKHIKIIVASLFITAGLTFSTASFAQPDPPVVPVTGTGTAMGGGSAPIGSGLFILLTAAAGYGAKKVRNIYNSRKEAE
ncbi:MAG: hypothetical protein HOO86_03040 [Bacteroidales bacterium]|nr:hypothetical protein [Bacteroidales bacterium]